MNIQMLNRDLSDYRVFREKIVNIVTALNNSISASELVASRIGDYYSIDDTRADANELQECRRAIETKRDFLNRTIIPAIDGQITAIQREIRMLEAVGRLV